MAEWVPKTKLGRMVLEGEIKSLDEIFKRGLKIREAEIVDHLVPNLKKEIIFIGGTPGKGGGIRRTPTRRTARMHKSGRRYNISAMVVVGNEDGYVGVGFAKSNDHTEAITKAERNAKMNIIPVRRGCGSWECTCGKPHSLAFKAVGKSGSVRAMLIPAPQGLGLCVPDEMKKVMRLAGIKDIWIRTLGNTRARINFTLAIYDAFRSMNSVREVESS